MVIPLTAITVGLVIGLVRGGRFRHLARLRPRWIPVGVLGVVGVLVSRYGPLDAPEMVLATSIGLCLAFCLANRRWGGLGVVAIGLCANLAPLVVNGTVPVDGDALVHAGVVDRDELATTDLGGGRSVADDGTRLLVLGDIIPLPELHQVISFGDLVVAMGLGAAARNAVRHRRLHGVPASRILAADTGDGDAADDEVIDLTQVEPRSARRQHPVEVSEGEPVPVPMGWGTEGDDELVGAGAGRTSSTTHVPWPWRRTPPPASNHPTMRSSRR